MLSPAQVEEFRAIYKKQFGKELSKEEALDKGSQLVRLMQFVYQPIVDGAHVMKPKQLKEVKKPRKLI